MIVEADAVEAVVFLPVFFEEPLDSRLRLGCRTWKVQYALRDRRRQRRRHGGRVQGWLRGNGRSLIRQSTYKHQGYVIPFSRAD